MADRETHAAAAVSTGQVGDASGRGDANEANEVVLVGEDEAKALFDDLCGTLPPRGKVGDGLVHGPKRFLVLFFVPAFSFFWACFAGRMARLAPLLSRPGHLVAGRSVGFRMKIATRGGWSLGGGRKKKKKGREKKAR